MPCKWQDKVLTLSCSLPLELPWRETCTRPLEWGKRESHSAVWMMRKARSWPQQYYQLRDLLLVLGFHKAIPKLSVLHKGVISWDHPVKAAQWALSWKGLKFRLCYTSVLKAPGNLEVVPYFLGCIWSIPAISICSGVMVQCQTWIQRDVVPVWRILCTSLSHHQAEAVSQHMQKQKDLGGGQIGIFQRNFHHFPVFFFSGLNLSVGSTPGSVISQSLLQ